MLLVVVGHAIQSLLHADCYQNHAWNIIYSFHMPAFMAISGWLAYRPVSNQTGEGKNQLIRRFRQLMIPFLLWSVINYLKQGKCTIQELCQIVVYPDSYFWFLWVLFFINALLIAGQMISRKLKIDEIIPFSVICIIMILVVGVFSPQYFGMQFIGYYFIFYILGYFVHRYSNFTEQPLISILILFVIWLFLAWNWNMLALPSWFPGIPYVPSSLIHYAYRGITAIIAIVIIFNFAPRVLNGKGYVNQYMSLFGQVSLGVYVIHLMFMGVIIRNCKLIMPSAPNLIIILSGVIIALIVSCVIVYILQKNKYTSQLLLGKL